MSDVSITPIWSLFDIKIKELILIIQYVWRIEIIPKE